MLVELRIASLSQGMHEILVPDDPLIDTPDTDHLLINFNMLHFVWIYLAFSHLFGVHHALISVISVRRIVSSPS
jgi:hypothetical protein